MQGHSFKLSARSMFALPGCRVCSGKIAVAGINDLVTTHPGLIDSWDFVVNGELHPSAVTARMSKRASWSCALGHKWEVAISDRTNINRGGRVSSCPYCSNKKVLKGFNDLASQFPQIAAQWDYEKNGEVNPDGVTYGTPTSFFWKCSRAHSFYSRVVDRTGRNIQCSTCMNQKLEVGFNDLATTNPKLAGQWHPTLNGTLSPTDIQGGSAGKAWWICELGHPWHAEIRQRNNYDTGCGVCNNLIILEGFNDLATSHPDLLAEWDWDRNHVAKPSEVVAGNRLKVWWKCSTCSKSWSASIVNRTSRASGCPSCSIGGYDTTMPGMLYFIGNDFLKARKIGITNPHAKQDRTREFSVLGWKIIKTWTHENGQIILNTETKMLQRVRGIYKLPPYLSKNEMGKLGGWSETYSQDGISDAEVIKQVDKELLEQIRLSFDFDLKS